MRIAKASAVQTGFHGLRIFDYTAENELSSSVAEIIIGPGAKHPRAYSKKSDKYYYLVSGNLEFIVENDSYGLVPGDVCVICKGQRFSYRNVTGEPAKVVLVHTPRFDLQSEVLEE